MDRFDIYHPKINIVLGVVEDDLHFQERLKAKLDELEVKNVLFITSIKDFVEKLEKRDESIKDIQVCIIDHYLGEGYTGLKVLEKLLAVNKYCFVIVVSAQANFDVVVEYVNKGAWKYLDKRGKKESEVQEQVLDLVEVAFTEIRSEVKFFSGITEQLHETKKNLIANQTEAADGRTSDT